MDFPSGLFIAFFHVNAKSYPQLFIKMLINSLFFLSIRFSRDGNYPGRFYEIPVI